MPDLRTLDRMEEATLRKLHKLGIKNTETLLDKGSMPADRRDIASKLGVSESLVNYWVIYSNFFLIKGLNSGHVHMLMASGVCSLIELGKYDPCELLDGLISLKNGNRNGSKLPTLGQVTDWINQARDLPWKIVYDGMYCFG